LAPTYTEPEDVAQDSLIISELAITKPQTQPRVRHPPTSSKRKGCLTAYSSDHFGDDDAYLIREKQQG
jgi:hypothetical protein